MNVFEQPEKTAYSPPTNQIIFVGFCERVHQNKRVRHMDYGRNFSSFFVLFIDFLSRSLIFHVFHVECDKIRGECLEEIQKEVVTQDRFETLFNNRWKQSASWLTIYDQITEAS